jgi:hypothetical protein
MGFDTEPGVIRSHERIADLGKTGSGKTTWILRRVWDQLDSVIFYDWKDQHASDLPAPRIESLEEVRAALFAEKPAERVEKFVYVPPPFDKSTEKFDQLCELVWRKGNIHLIADELKGVYQEGGGVKPITDHHEAIMTRGRARGIGMSNLSQRPKKIPLEAISEAEHIVAFRLNLEADRDRLGEVFGKEHTDKIRNLSGHEWVYYHEALPEPVVRDPIQI